MEGNRPGQPITPLGPQALQQLHQKRLSTSSCCKPHHNQCCLAEGILYEVGCGVQDCGFVVAHADSYYLYLLHVFICSVHHIPHANEARTDLAFLFQTSAAFTARAKQPPQARAKQPAQAKQLGPNTGQAARPYRVGGCGSDPLPLRRVQTL